MLMVSVVMVTNSGLPHHKEAQQWNSQLWKQNEDRGSLFNVPLFSFPVFGDLWCGENHPPCRLFQLPPTGGPILLRPRREALDGAGVCRRPLPLRLPPTAYQRPTLRLPARPGTPSGPQQLERALGRQPVEDGTLGRSMFSRYTNTAAATPRRWSVLQAFFVCLFFSLRSSEFFFKFLH